MDPSGGAGYVVTPEALARAASAIRAAVDAARGVPAGDPVAGQSGVGVGGPVLDAAAVGHSGLARALAEFCQRWDAGVAELARAGRQVAGELEDSGSAYQRVEHGTQEMLKRLFVDAFGNPTTDSAHAANASWSDLRHDAAPDTSAASAQRAARHSLDAVTSAAADLAEHTIPGMIARALNGENPLTDIGGDLRGLRTIVD